MATETITLDIDSDAARAVKLVSAADWKKLQLLFGIWLKEYARAGSASLRETMNEISEKAQDRGLTPEVLESLLRQE